MSSIPDEAVDAAAEAYYQATGWMPVDTHAMQEALQAALPHLTASVDREYSTVLLQAELKMSQQAERIRKLEDGIIEAVSALEHGPLRQITLSNEHIEQLRRRLRALLAG